MIKYLSLEGLTHFYNKIKDKFQFKIDEELVTNSKDIVGAINELSDSHFKKIFISYEFFNLPQFPSADDLVAVFGQENLDYLYNKPIEELVDIYIRNVVPSENYYTKSASYLEHQTSPESLKTITITFEIYNSGFNHFSKSIRIIFNSSQSFSHLVTYTTFLVSNSQIMSIWPRSDSEFDPESVLQANLGLELHRRVSEIEKGSVTVVLDPKVLDVDSSYTHEQILAIFPNSTRELIYKTATVDKKAINYILHSEGTTGVYSITLLDVLVNKQDPNNQIYQFKAIMPYKSNLLEVSSVIVWKSGVLSARERSQILVVTSRTLDSTFNIYEPNKTALDAYAGHLLNERLKVVENTVVAQNTLLENRLNGS